MTKNKIDKKIHYVWFGKGKKNDEFEKYLNSWRKFCPDYEIIEWNEDNYDINKNFYCAKFYKKKMWAFASDYARLDILFNEGGIYLDTDIELLKKLDPLLNNECFFGFQDVFNIGCSIIGAKKNHPLIKEILNFYDDRKTRKILPNLLNKILKNHHIKKYSKKVINGGNFTIYPKEYFYPYAYFEKKENMKITKDTYAIHHYDASWLPKVITKYFFPVIGIISKRK